MNACRRNGFESWLRWSLFSAVETLTVWVIFSTSLYIWFVLQFWINNAKQISKQIKSKLLVISVHITVLIFYAVVYKNVLLLFFQ